VARALAIRVGTVVKHLEHLYPKLGVTSRGAATAMALAVALRHGPTVDMSSSSVRHDLLSERNAMAERLAGAFAITPREAEVLACLAAGLTNSEVARELSVQVRTVVKHLEHLYPKLGVANRCAAIAKAMTALG
jgi:DNA-binding CsgD family transcriptional regulator